MSNQVQTGQKLSKMAKKNSKIVQHFTTWPKLAQNGWKWSRIYQKVHTLSKMVQNCPKWSNTVLYGLIWSNMVQLLSTKSSKLVRRNQVSWSSFERSYFMCHMPRVTCVKKLRQCKVVKFNLVDFA